MNYLTEFKKQKLEELKLTDEEAELKEITIHPLQKRSKFCVQKKFPSMSEL